MIKLNLRNVTPEEMKLLQKDFEEFSVKFDEKKVKRLKECLEILDSLKLNYDGLEPAILLFKLKEGAITAEEIKKKFGESMFWLVDTMLTIENFRYRSEENEAEKIRSMFIAMAQDLRVVFITLANVLSRLRNIEDYAIDRQQLICKYTEEIYAPLAEKLGFSNIKGEMEDICFKLLNPIECLELNTKINEFWPAIDGVLEDLKNELTKMLKECNIDGEVFSRKKHTSSVYKKLKNKNLNLKEIYDLAAVRILVNNVEDCYLLLGKIHAVYKPMPGRVKDYIAMPKSNGYQSLHTTIIYNNNKPIEVQIRTYDMHRNSEFGIASHWLYKEKRSQQNTLDKKFSWLREIIDLRSDISSSEFLDLLKIDLSNESVFVQTPRGKVIELVKGATIIDFAYFIHSDIGDKCVGATINGKVAKLKTELKTGDTVEIMTNALSKGPSREWLKICKTITAKNRINHFFKNELKDENIKKGKIILEHATATKGYKFAELFTEEYLKEVYKKFAFNSEEDMFAAVGYGSISSIKIIQKLVLQLEKDKEKEITNDEKIKAKFAKNIEQSEDGIIIDGDVNTQFIFAKCCNPIAGDEIEGYVSRGRGVVIHRKDCRNIKYLEKERLIDAKWGDDFKNSLAAIDVYANENAGALNKIVNIISANKIAIISIITSPAQNDQIKMTVKVKIKDIAELARLINIIGKEPYVNSVRR